MTYRSVASALKREIVINKSRFITYLSPMEGQENCEAWLEQIRAEHPLATHVCYAYVSDKSGAHARASDDGEPKGTAGMPMLDVLTKQGLRCIACAVVRYFGGVKLGAGGLVRAYSSSVAGAVEEAQIAEYAEFELLQLSVGYDEAPRVRVSEEIDRAYGDSVEISFAVRKEDVDTLVATVGDKLGRKVDLKRIGSKYLPLC